MNSKRLKFKGTIDKPREKMTCYISGIEFSSLIKIYRASSGFVNIKMKDLGNGYGVFVPKVNKLK